MDTVVSAGFAKSQFDSRVLHQAGFLGNAVNIQAEIFTKLIGVLPHRHELADICDALPRHRDNFTVLDIQNTMANLGYEVRQFKTRMDFMDPRLYPVLFVPNDDAAIFLVWQEKDGRNIVFDGAQTLDLNFAAWRKLRGTAYVFHKSKSDVMQRIATDQKASGKSWFRIVLRRLKPIIKQVVFTSFLINVITLMLPLLMMIVYDKVIGSQSIATLPMMAVGLAAAIVGEALLRHMRALQFTWLGSRIDNMVGNEIFRHLLQLPSQLIERASVASQLARIKSFETIRDFFGGSVFLSLMDVPYVALLVLAIWAIAGNLALVSIVMAGFYLAILYYFYGSLKISAYHAAKTGSQLQQSTLEAFDKSEALRYTGLCGQWHGRFHDLSGRTAYAAFDYAHRNTVLETIAYSFYVLAGLATLYLGVGKVVAGEITTGALIATMILTWRALSPISTLCTSLPRIEQLRHVIGQVNRLMTMAAQKEEDATGKIAHRIKGQIEFSYVGLRYSKSSDPVFAGLSFKIAPGQILAVAGSNGSGKSTVLKLANGMYRPQAGTIRIDGIDIRQIEPGALHRHIAYVSQHPEFFNGTIADNLRLVAPLAERARLLQVMDLVDAGVEMSAMPLGIDTPISGQSIGHMGGSFAYKLNLARALLQDTPILLMDELPTALLNGHSGKKIHQMIHAYRGQKTIIMVTHREDFIRQSDAVLGLRAGKIPLFGNPSAILQQLQNSGDNL